MNPSVSVIVTFNSSSDIEACLQAVDPKAIQLKRSL